MEGGHMRVPSRRKRAMAILLTGFVAAGAATSVSAPAAGAAGSNKLTVKAGEYTYEFSGKPKSGWVQVDFVNDGTEMHMLDIVPLKKGVTAKQLKTALLSDDENAGNDLVVRSGNFDPQPGILSPKQDMSMMLQMPAGHYGAFCFVSAPDGQPHVAHGMVKTFDVSSDKSSLKPPTDAVANVTIDDTGIVLPSSGLTRNGWIKVTNKTDVTRDATFAALASGATFEQADAYFAEFFQSGKLPEGEPPAALDGGVGQLAAGGTAYVLPGMKAGNYVLVSSNGDVDNDPNEFHVEFTLK
jgi:hypothetical protein